MECDLSAEFGGDFGDEVAITLGDSAGENDGVGGLEGELEVMAKLEAIIGNAMDREEVEPSFALEKVLEERPIAIAYLPRFGGGPGFDEFISGVEDDDSEFSVDRKFGWGEGHEGDGDGGSDGRAGRDEDVAGFRIFALSPNVLAALPWEGAGWDLDGGRRFEGLFAADDEIGFEGDGGSGEDFAGVSVSPRGRWEAGEVRAIDWEVV